MEVAIPFSLMWVTQTNDGAKKWQVEVQIFKVNMIFTRLTNIYGV